MESVAISFWRGSFFLRDQTHLSCIAGRYFTARSPGNSISSIQCSHSVMSDSLLPYGLQHARLSCPSPTPRACSNSCTSSRWCHPTSHPPSFPSLPVFNLSQRQGLFKWVSSLHQVAKMLVSASASVLPMNIQDWFPLGWTVWSHFSPRDSQESSPTPQFKSINSSVLSFLYSPTLTSIHDYWENHSFD